MKLFITIFFTCILLKINAFANPYALRGKILGGENFNYAYLISSSTGELIVKLDIKDGLFNFDGEYQEELKFGELPMLSLLISNKDMLISEIKKDRLNSHRKHNNCNLVLADSIDVIYNTDSKVFSIAGGKSNKVQNLFEHGYSTFRNERDSSYQVIDKLTLSDKDKETQKVVAMKGLFTKAMYGFIEIVKENPASEVSLNNFGPIIYDQGISGEEALTTFNIFTDELRESRYGKRMYLDIMDKLNAEKAMAKPPYMVGMKMPAFKLINDKDSLISSELNYGKYTLIDFWATWCMPCRKETPNIIAAFNNYHIKGFNVITVSIDDNDAQHTWVEAIKIEDMEKFTNLFNGGDLAGLTRELKIVSIPNNYLVDENGVIVAINLRGEQLIEKLKKLLPN